MSSMFSASSRKSSSSDDGLGEQLDQRGRVRERRDRECARPGTARSRPSRAMSRRTSRATCGRCTLTTTSSPRAQPRRVHLRDRRRGEALLVEAREHRARAAGPGPPRRPRARPRTARAAPGRAGCLNSFDELVGEETAPRRDDLPELDVRRSEPLERRRSRRESAGARLRAGRARRSTQPPTARARCRAASPRLAKRSSGGRPAARTSSGSKRLGLGAQVSDVRAPRHALRVDEPGPGIRKASRLVCHRGEGYPGRPGNRKRASLAEPGLCCPREVRERIRGAPREVRARRRARERRDRHPALPGHGDRLQQGRRAGDQDAGAGARHGVDRALRVHELGRTAGCASRRSATGACGARSTARSGSRR